MALDFEKFVSRSIARFLSDELDLSGMKMSVNDFLEIAVFGALGFLVLVTILVYVYTKLGLAISIIGGIASGVIFVFALYTILEFNIDKRKNFVETLLPDYIQLTAANMRSGISLDKAMIAAARPEFGYFSEDVKLMDKQIYAGETMQSALIKLGTKYRSRQLQHMMRMMTESIRHGGSMNDLLRQMAKDLRNQMTIQKEISGQLFLYTIFIAFAVLIGAPALYALTNKMISITDTIWSHILQSNPNGLPSTGVAFLKPSPPKITASDYYTFAVVAVVMVTALGSLIISVIATGSMIRGIKYLPVFVVVGLAVFFIVGIVIGSLFSSLG